MLSNVSGFTGVIVPTRAFHVYDRAFYVETSHEEDRWVPQNFRTYGNISKLVVLNLSVIYLQRRYSNTENYSL